MAKRNKRSASADMIGVVAGFVGLMVEVCKVMFAVLAWLIPALFRAVVAVLRGVAWFLRRAAEEGKQLDEDRRAKWEDRLERWDARRLARWGVYPDEVEEEEDEVEEAAVLPILPIAEEVEGEVVEADEVEEDEEDEVFLPEIEEDPATLWALSTMPYESVEKAVSVLERRLKCLEARKEKAEFVNRADEGGEEWHRYQNTKAWRGLLWEIQHTQAQLEMLGAD